MILAVEDDPAVAKGLLYGLRDEGFSVSHATNGSAAIESVSRAPPDLVLLDIRLPDMNGFDVCRRLREEGFTMPIIMVTARDEEVDRVLGLEIGADDYVVKPYSFRELVSRIRAQLRRSYGAYRADASAVSIGDLKIDPERIEVRKSGQEIALTPIEFRLLLALVHHMGSPLSRSQLIEQAWGPSTFLEDERTVDVHIRHLRAKIEDDPGSPCIIETVRGFGYRIGDMKKSS